LPTSRCGFAFKLKKEWTLKHTDHWEKQANYLENCRDHPEKNKNNSEKYRNNPEKSGKNP
jgi:hypothetical protein